MKVSKTVLYGISVVCFFSTLMCTNTTHQTAITPLLFKSISKIKIHELPEKFHVFYFDGDCGLCIGKISMIKKSLKLSKDSNSLFLVALTKDSVSFNYNMKQLKSIDPIVMLDDDSAAYPLKMNDLALINRDGEILSRKQIN